MRYRAGYTCDDPDCCFDQEVFDTREEAEEMIAPFKNHSRFDTWIDEVPE